MINLDYVPKYKFYNKAVQGLDFEVEDLPYAIADENIRVFIFDVIMIRATHYGTKFSFFTI